jgi:hypothetical protein
VIFEKNIGTVIIMQILNIDLNKNYDSILLEGKRREVHARTEGR